MPLEDIASAPAPTAAVAAKDAAVVAEPATKKQKHEVEGPKPAPSGPRSFKTIGKVVLAMKRFQAALNPTYEYGKQKQQHPPGPRHVRTPSPTSLPSGEESEEAVHYAYQDRGHKASILFGKLPDVPSESQ